MPQPVLKTIAALVVVALCAVGFRAAAYPQRPPTDGASRWQRPAIGADTRSPSRCRISRRSKCRVRHRCRRGRVLPPADAADPSLPPIAVAERTVADLSRDAAGHDAGRDDPRAGRRRVSDTDVSPNVSPSGMRPWFPPGGRQTFFQKVKFTGDYLPRFGNDGLGMTDAELDVVFALPFLTVETPLLITPFYARALPRRPGDARRAAAAARRRDHVPEHPADQRPLAGDVRHHGRPVRRRRELRFRRSVSRHGRRSGRLPVERPVGNGCSARRTSIGSTRRSCRFSASSTRRTTTTNTTSCFPCRKSPGGCPGPTCPAATNAGPTSAANSAAASGRSSTRTARPTELDITDWRVFLGLERRIIGGLSRHVELGYVFLRKLEYQEVGKRSTSERHADGARRVDVLEDRSRVESAVRAC